MFMRPLQVKDTEAYEAIASNTSGSTPRDLFEDVTEELEQKVLISVVPKLQLVVWLSGLGLRGLNIDF